MTKDLSKDQREVAGELALAISQGRQHMEKCFACAFEAIQILALTPPDSENDEMVPLAGMYACIEKTFGVELIDEAKNLIQFNLTSSFVQYEAMTTCIIWQLGHAIEHATMISSPKIVGKEVIN